MHSPEIRERILVQFLDMLKNFFGHRIWTVMVACLAVVMLVFLAGGLGNVHFEPGRPIAWQESVTFGLSITKVTTEIVDIPLWKQIAFWGLIFLLVLIVAYLFPPEWRKKILKYFLRYTLFVLAIIFLVKNFQGLLPELKPGKAGAASSIPGSLEAVPTVFTPPQVPPALLYLASLGALIALAGFAFLIGRRWRKKQLLRKINPSLEGLAEVARTSLAAISKGQKWENVIITCYARMSEVAGAQRGILRRKDLTASEYLTRLEGAGLPREAVQRLTRLFEAARYGTKHGPPGEEAEAISCLRVVLQACGVSE